MSEISQVLQAFGIHGCKPKVNGKERWSARCPAHDDRTSSASIRVMPDGWITLKCFAGCTRRQILMALGLDWEVLSPDGFNIEKRRRHDGTMAPYPSSGDFKPQDIWQFGRQELGVMLHILNAAEKGPLPPNYVARIPQCRDMLIAMLRELG